MMMGHPYPGAPPPPQMHHSMQMIHPDMQHAHMGYAHPSQAHYGSVFALVDQLGEVDQMPASEPAPARSLRRSVKRNPDAPKRPMSPYVTFVKAKWSETYEQMGPYVDVLTSFPVTHPPLAPPRPRT